VLEAKSAIQVLGQQRLQMAQLQAAAAERVAAQARRSVELTPARFRDAAPPSRSIDDAERESDRAQRNLADVERRLNLLA